MFRAVDSQQHCLVVVQETVFWSLTIMVTINCFYVLRGSSKIFLGFIEKHTHFNYDIIFIFGRTIPLMK